MATARAHKRLRHKHLRLVTQLMRQARPGLPRDERHQLIDDLHSLTNACAWDVAVLEDSALRQALSVGGYGGARGLNKGTHKGRYNHIARVRAAHGLTPHPRDRFEKLFLRDARAYAAAHDISVTAAEERSQRNAVKWATAHVDRELSLARRGTQSHSLQRRGIQRFRRVLSLEACPFCILVADRTYTTDALMPTHTGCQCGVMALDDNHSASDFSDPAALVNAREVKVYRRRHKNADRQLAATQIEHYNDASYGPSLKGYAPSLASLDN